MNGSIFLIQPGETETLVELHETAYEAEAVLQGLLARYPALLAGDQMNPATPRRWFLVTQEMGVPDGEVASDRWSLDHLFLDQEAIPTLIETKRSSDTRIRREVVGQMLDYAANAVVYWPLTKIIAAYETTCRNRGQEPAEALDEFLNGAMSAEEFWTLVDTNLKAGRIRMVFVADVIPPELRRIVEFLNGQMNAAEVLAVEIKQFTGQALRTLVPRVIGATAESEAKKRVTMTTGRAWDEALFLEPLRAAGHPELEPVYRRLRDWMIERQLKPFWGTGRTGYFGWFVPHAGRRYVCAYLTTACQVNVAFYYAKSAPGFENEDRRWELAQRLNQIQGLSIPRDKMAGYFEFPMTLLTQPEALDHFLATLDWFFSTVRDNLASTK